MAIGPTTTVTTPATAAAPAAKPAGDDRSAAGIAADFQTFLTLLTTQMRNQDPLKPMESTEFIAQLAAFSGVEQQVRANERLDGIRAALGDGTSAGLAAWIGREVRAPVTAGYAGDPVAVGLAPAAGADKTVLLVENDFGTVVARRTLAGDATEATWDGTDDLGTPLAHGRYGFTVESYDGDTLIGSSAGTVYATVAEVRIADGAPLLVVEGGDRVALDTVTGLR